MNSNQHAGRPRSHDVDDAILRAAIELLATNGADWITVNSVARRTGVARASIYLRYPNRQALVEAALRATIGREPYELEGDLEADLRQGAMQAQAILDSPTFRAAFPEVVRGLLRQAGDVGDITSEMVAPNRRPIADAYRTSAAAAGLRTDVDPDLPFKMIVGGVLMTLLFDGVPATVEQASQIADLVIDGLRSEPRGHRAPDRAHRAKRTSGPA
jgi:AcrR family transcriptional regulator